VDTVRHSPEATTIAITPVRSDWLPATTSAVFLALMGTVHAAHPDLAAAYRDPPVRVAAIAVTVAGVVMAVLRLRSRPARRRAAGRERSVDIGWNVLAVLVALWVSLVETAAPFWSGRAGPGISAVAPWVIVICLAMRAPLGRTMTTAMAAATMWPLAASINAVRFGLAIPWATLAVPAFLNYGLAALTCLIRRASSPVAGTTPSAAQGDLGSYRLLAPIGVGGMGEVWKATHQLLARQAAIKLVRPRNAEMTAAQKDQWVRRFHREANTIAGLQSPNTIYLYDFGVAQDGQFYYVMELLDGVSLDMLVKTFGPQPPARVRHILRQICESLEEAHQRNLVHRDLKPSNIMLCKLALAYDFIKVLDFGLAKCAACEDVAQITMENVAAGTPGYIAPEVALGAEGVDGRADIYALGCVAYYLLTGELVFDDPNPMSMVVKHVQTPPVPPSQRTDLPIPADLERVVLACLEKSQAARPPSARHVAAALDACDLPGWTEEQAADWWERHLPEASTLRAPNRGEASSATAEYWPATRSSGPTTGAASSRGRGSSSSY
jgi:eukaryotic-like serine/threonine-protein kinase